MNRRWSLTGDAVGTLGALRPPLAEGRFWLVQVLVATIAALHFLVEWAHEQERLMGFLDGIKDLPVPANIVPVLLAGIWYGMRGGLLTGAMTMALGVPNLVLFHDDGFTWMGEALTNLVVVTVGLAVASVVERNFELRRRAEVNGARLRILWDLSGALNGCESGDEMIAATVNELAGAQQASAVGYAWQGEAAFAAFAGDRDTEPRLRDVLLVAGDGRGDMARHAHVGVFEVATSSHAYGSIVVECAGGGACAEDARVFSLAANELASALETLAHRDAERMHLRGYARAVTAAQENERRRIARDLHDGPVQSMIVINRALARLDGPHPGEGVAELRDLVHETLGAIQRTSSALRPLLLDDLGLVSAIRTLAERRSKRTALTVRVEVHGEERRLDPEVEVVVYRIAQEALTNVERHAETDEASVVIEFGEHGLTMEIRDRGRGMEPDDEFHGESFGIVGMRERAELVGGSLQIESVPGEGTTVTLTVP